MYTSFDIIEFGKEVQKIRLKNNFTQKYVSEKTHIHLDTLRKLENGYTIPKYDTLELLSKIYMTDLLLVLKDKRVNRTILNYYNLIDDFLVNNDLKNMIFIENEFSEYLGSSTTNLIDNDELLQLQCFINVCKLFYTNEDSDNLKAKELILKYFQISNTDFSIDKFECFHYNELELRLLYIYGTIEMCLKNNITSITILNFVCTYLLNYNYSSNHINKLIIKSYTSISYSYHMVDNHSKSFEYANLGIQFAIKNNILYMLHNLYARKTISEKLMNLDNYIDSHQKCLVFLELCDDAELLIKYKTIFSEMYDIH